MKNLKAFLIVAVFGAVLAFPSHSNAKIGDRLKARKARKQAATTIQYTSPDCTITGCPIHSQPGTGKLGVNSKGGFTGQLTDEYYADHFAKKTGAAANETAKNVPAKNAEVDSADTASTGAVAEAEEALAEAKRDLFERKATGERNVLEKQEALRLAIVAQNQADAREALKLQQEIDDRNTRLEALQPEETD